MNKYNNAHHITIQTKPADVNRSIYINFNKKDKKKDPKFKVNENVRISK